MDRHSLAAPIEENLPAILALLEYWNSTRLDMASHSLLPYDERFRVMAEHYGLPLTVALHAWFAIRNLLK